MVPTNYLAGAHGVPPPIHRQRHPRDEGSPGVVPQKQHRLCDFVWLSRPAEGVGCFGVLEELPMENKITWAISYWHIFIDEGKNVSIHL